MGILEWIMVIVFVMNGIRTYRRQEYPLDRWIAKMFRRIRSRFKRK